MKILQCVSNAKLQRILSSTLSQKLAPVFQDILKMEQIVKFATLLCVEDALDQVVLNVSHMLVS